MLFKNSVRISKRTPHFTITKINWLMLFKEIIAAYCENHTVPINTKYSVTSCYDGWSIQSDPKVAQPMGSLRRFEALCADP
jgi:hypothetical protein